MGLFYVTYIIAAFFAVGAFVFFLLGTKTKIRIPNSASAVCFFCQREAGLGEALKELSNSALMPKFRKLS